MRSNRTESLPEENFFREEKITKGNLSEVLEVLSEENFPLRDSRSCCPSLCWPLIFLQLRTVQVIPIVGSDGSFGVLCYTHVKTESLLLYLAVRINGSQAGPSITVAAWECCM